MPSRSILLVVMAVVLLARTLHCCAVQATLCGLPVSDAAGTPLRDPDDADPNETGCVCKGVLPQAPAPLEAVQPELEGLNPLAAAPAAALLAWPAAPCRPIDRHLLGPPPVGGMTLRTWIGSLLI